MDNFGQSSPTIRSVKLSPMKATSSPTNCASKTTLPSKKSCGPTCAWSSFKPSKVQSALTCTVLNQGSSVWAKATERESSARKPALPMMFDRCGRKSSLMRAMIGSCVWRDFFPFASNLMRRLANSRSSGVARLTATPLASCRVESIALNFCVKRARRLAKRTCATFFLARVFLFSLGFCRRECVDYVHSMVNASGG